MREKGEWERNAAFATCVCMSGGGQYELLRLSSEVVIR